MSRPGADPASGISLGDALRRPKRHPACNGAKLNRAGKRGKIAGTFGPIVRIVGDDATVDTAMKSRGW
jgi:hypothetical protein